MTKHKNVGETQMDAELVKLAGSGATTIVTLMATDLWGQTRDRIGRLFARHGDTSAVLAELEESRAELAAAGQPDAEVGVADVEAEWRGRLRRALQSDPSAAAELRALLDEVGPRLAESAGPTVHNSITGGTQYGPVLQAHTINGGLTFTLGAPAADSGGRSGQE